METIIKDLLIGSAIYCAIMYVIVAAHGIRTRTDVEVPTFHLGLCFILSLGFLLLAHGG